MDAASASARRQVQAPQWWEQRWFIALVVLATAIPLLYPAIPPLVDLPGHIGRYRVQLDLAQSPALQHFYQFQWAAIGNLGVDLLIVPLSAIMGLEAAVKLVVLLIPPLTAAGFLWIAREVHGRVPPTAIFALPFIYSAPFLFGFVNFALSVALAFLAFGLWLRLGRLGKTILRGWLFVPISLIVFFCHAYGWGLLGLLCFAAETVTLHRCAKSWPQAALGAALRAAVMALPVAIMLIWQGGGSPNATSGWFDWSLKWRWIYAALRDRWSAFDMASLAFCSIIIAYGFASPELTVSRRLAFAAALLAILFLLLPRIAFASAYADMRMVPYLFAVALIAIRVRDAADRRTGQMLAFIGLLFFSGRLAATTISLAMAAKDQSAKLAAVDLIPRGARVASFFALPRSEPWSLPRNSHLGAMVIVRRDGFSNEQWLLKGVNLLTLKYQPQGFAYDPSEIVRPNDAPDGYYRTVDEALAALPRDKFDFVWLLDVPQYDPQRVRDFQLVWRNANSVLFRIGPRPRP